MLSKPFTLCTTVLWLAAACPASAIVGGMADETLSTSTIMVLKSNGGVCSGVVIAPDVVLTAAHCATGADEYRIHYRGDQSSDGGPVLITPAAKAVHPGYNADAVKARKPSVDLALFRLPQPLPEKFAPARLSADHPGAGDLIIAGGYGLTEIGKPTSSGIFRTAKLQVTEPYGPGKILIWSKGIEGQVATGDSGGPQFVGKNVFAVTAWAQVLSKSPYASSAQGILLGPQREWINRTLTSWGRSALWGN